MWPGDRVTCQGGKPVLKKITATGLLAAAATGVMLSGGSASAERASAGQTVYRDCYYTAPGYYQPGWCNGYAPPTYVPPVSVYPGVPYGYGYGWGRWRGGWDRYHFHR